MSILAKFSQLKQTYDKLSSVQPNPFAVTFDQILSSTEGVVEGRRTILLGTNNYLGLTMDPDCIEQSVQALRQQGTGTTGSRVANGSYASHRALEQDLAKF